MPYSWVTLFQVSYRSSPAWKKTQLVGPGGVGEFCFCPQLAWPYSPLKLETPHWQKGNHTGLTKEGRRVDNPKDIGENLCPGSRRVAFPSVESLLGALLYANTFTHVLLDLHPNSRELVLSLFCRQGMQLLVRGISEPFKDNARVPCGVRPGAGPLSANFKQTWRQRRK